MKDPYKMLSDMFGDHVDYLQAPCVGSGA
jgi:hypothetical protein